MQAIKGKPALEEEEKEEVLAMDLLRVAMALWVGDGVCLWRRRSRIEVRGNGGGR